MTSGVLERIVDQTRAAIERRERERPLSELHADLHVDIFESGALRAALARPGIGVIAEFKRRSPSAGTLREHADVAQIVRAYESAGAAAISVLTEEANFDGSLADLQVAAAGCSIPVLRKDFIVDSYQLYEAALADADAVLLIVAALTEPELQSLRFEAFELGLDVLVEVHDERELERAVAVDADIIGVNNRDLRDFSVDVTRTFELLDRMPNGAIVVSESGIADAEQVRELERAGVAAVLVGESLMRSADPGEALGRLLGNEHTR